MVKMNGCAAIDSARPFRFLADKAAVAADFHLGNGACYYEEQRIASTASVATLAKTGVVRPRFPCRIASKSGEYPHRKNRAFQLTAETPCFHFWDSPKPLS